MSPSSEKGAIPAPEGPIPMDQDQSILSWDDNSYLGVNFHLGGPFSLTRGISGFPFMLTRAAMRFIDIGANLTDPMFRGVYRGKHAHEDDLKLVLDRARKAGVEKLIITGGNLEDSQEAVNLIKEHNDDNILFSTVGCHPTRCKEFEDHPGGPADYLDKLLKMVTENKSTVVAVGECGLDYDRLHFCSKEIQKKYFELQFDIAERTKLPMFLHNRNTGEDFYTMIKANRHRFSQGVVHSFTGSIEEMKKLVELGLYIGVNGCSMKTEENLQVIKEIPVDRLMIETDAPWCEIRPTHASHKHLSKISKEEMELYAPLSKKKEKFEMGYMVKSRCEPCATGLVLHVIASLREEDPKALAEAIWNNTCKVFFPGSV